MGNISIGQIIGVTLAILFIVIVLFGVAILLRQSRKQEQADPAKPSGGGEDIPKGQFRAGPPKRFRLNSWLGLLLIAIVVTVASCGTYHVMESNRKHDLSDATKEYVRTAELPDYMTEWQHVDVYRRTQGSGIIDAPDKTAKVMRVATGNNDISNPKGVAFGSCATKFHFRYRWQDTGLWSNEVHECQVMEVVHAPVGTLEVEIWMEMTDGTVSNSIVKFLKYRRA